MTTPDTITESQTQNFPHLCWSCSLHQGHPASWACKPSDATASAPDTRVTEGQQTQGQRSPRRPRSCQDSALLRLKARLQQQEKTMDPIGKHLGTEAQELASGSRTDKHRSILLGCTHCHLHLSALAWPLATLLSVKQITRDIQIDVTCFKKFSTTISIPRVTNYRVLFGTNKIFFGNKFVCREMKSITNMHTICEYAFIHIFLVMLIQLSLQLSCRSDESHPTNNNTQAIVMLNST